MFSLIISGTEFTNLVKHSESNEQVPKQCHQGLGVTQRARCRAQRFKPANIPTLRAYICTFASNIKFKRHPTDNLTVCNPRYIGTDPTAVRGKHLQVIPFF